jgi:mono/diheme cytochrome c family protein
VSSARPRSLVAVGALIVGALIAQLVTACAAPVRSPRNTGPWAVEVFANGVETDDPRAEGQWMFLHETWGAELHDSWPPAWFLDELLATEADTFGPQFTNFGTLFDPRDTLPIGLKRGTVDRERVHETCAFCHVADLPDGRRWLGAPNARLDVGGLRVAINERWVAAGYPSLLSDLEIDKLSQLGPGRTDASSAGYPTPVPADFPSYFNLGAKTALNHLGTGGDLRAEMAMALYAFGAGAPPGDNQVPLGFPTHDRVGLFRSFLGSLEPPVSTEVFSAARLSRGREVFDEQQCGACHVLDDVSALGVVTHRGDGPELLPGEDPAFERGTIATSAAHRVLIDGDDEDSGDGEGGGIDLGRAALIAFIVTGGYSIGPTDGYRVPDLHGVWATAPYLHNGSVESLEQLLTPPADRPLVFERAGFTLDARAPGNDNGGHSFGSELLTPDRDALIAFLKSL